MKSPSDGSCTERWLPTFFLKVCKNSFLPLHIFGGLSTAFKVDGCFADSLDPQVPTLMLLRKLVAQKRCPRKFPRCFLPQNSGDGLSQKFWQVLVLKFNLKSFSGHSFISPWPRTPELPHSPRAELVRSYRHGRVRQDLGFEILGLKSLCLGITRNSIEMMELTGDGTNVLFFC